MNKKTPVNRKRRSNNPGASSSYPSQYTPQAPQSSSSRWQQQGTSQRNVRGAFDMSFLQQSLQDASYDSDNYEDLSDYEESKASQDAYGRSYEERRLQNRETKKKKNSGPKFFVPMIPVNTYATMAPLKAYVIHIQALEDNEHVPVKDIENMIVQAVKANTKIRDVYVKAKSTTKRDPQTNQKVQRIRLTFLNGRLAMESGINWWFSALEDKFELIHAAHTDYQDLV